MGSNDGNYGRLSSFIREYIYEKKWDDLRDIQDDCIAAVLDRDEHILIAAGTASGKTEAAFFPVISALAEKKPPTVGVLYIGPLKALINDQGERLRPLAALGGIPLRLWHGDAPDNQKKKLLAEPAGILQITPESLEALLLRRPEKIRALFAELLFVIIDEVHAFMGSSRGSQILCQLSRIEAEAGCRPRRIGLSATLGDYREAMDWLSLGTDRRTILINEGKTKRRLSIALDYFWGTDRSAEQHYYEALYRQCRNLRCIIFTNSRLEAEETIAALREVSAKYRGEDQYHIHHGSISAALRAETEKALRESTLPMTTAATATLELGIDIGSLDRIIQIGPPLSVAGFVQRLGRSGRRTGKPEIYFTCLEDAPATASLRETFPWALLKTIAIIDLYLKDKWIEPAYNVADTLPYSLLCHQSLSILFSLGEHSPVDLARRVLGLPVFSHIPLEDYRELLTALAGYRLIEKTEEGGLIIGLEGERLTAHYSFYSTFADSSEYRVLQGDRELGKVNFLPPLGSGIILGGRCWRVEKADPGSREIRVVPGEAGSLRVWKGGGAELHPRIVQRMREILCGPGGMGAAETYAYLSPAAASRLEEARSRAAEWGINADEGGCGQGASWLERGGNTEGSFTLYPWMGSKGMRTLLLVLQNEECRKSLCINSLYRENDFALHIGSSLAMPLFQDELKKILAGLRAQGPESLLNPSQIPLTDKFDQYLPAKLLVKQYIASMALPAI
ncbi:ATP-dependent helicase [Spirochaetia bacterium]|nr:ATP-dependent helicase [Spirochaetia bacterium]